MDEIYETYKKFKILINDYKDGDKEKWQYYSPLLLQLEENLNKSEKDGPDYFKFVAMLASIYYEQARLLISKSDLKTSLANLNVSIDLMKDYKNHPQIIYIYLRIVNLYSYLQAKNGNLEEAKIILLNAEQLYYSMESKENISIFNTDELFKSDTENINVQNTIKLEKLVTNNLQMLGWIYNKQNLQDTFVIYHHTVLQRQLEHQDGNALTWVLKCARLSSYFLSKQRFREARHHLAAALVILQEYEKELRDYHEGPNFLEEWEELQHYYADVARYWVKYGLFLFNASRSHNMKSFYTSHPLEDIVFIKKQKENSDLNHRANLELMKDKGDDHEEMKLKKETERKKSDHDSEKLKAKDEIKVDRSSTGILKENLLLFPTLNLDSIEKQVTDEYITTTEQARSLFLHSQTWLKRSKQFYTIHEYTLDYVNAILDLSELYRYLAFYEVDIDSQYNVQKRRADVLETLSNILKDVRPQCYIAVSIELFRELAEVQIELLALNMQKLYYTDAASAVQNLTMVPDYNVRKMEALSDIHSRLETFQDRMKFKN